MPSRRRAKQLSAADYHRHRSLYLQRWVPRTIALTDDQVDTVRAIADRYQLSLSEIVDGVLGEYLPHRFGIAWPVVHRAKHRWRLSEFKLRRPGSTMRVYGMLFTPAQDAAIKDALGRLGLMSVGQASNGAFSAMVEDAMGKWTHRLYYTQWPATTRRCALPPDSRAS